MAWKDIIVNFFHSNERKKQMKLKKFIFIVGILLILGGAGSFVYHRITYTTEENVAEIGVGNVGSVKLTTEKEKHISIPPIISGISVVLGIIFIVIGARPNTL